MSQYCIHCGNQCEDDAVFCGACGKAIQTVATYNQNKPTINIPSTKTLQSSTVSFGKKIVRLIFALIVVFFIFLIATVVVSLNSNAGDLVKPLTLIIAAIISIFVIKKMVNP